MLGPLVSTGLLGAAVVVLGALVSGSSAAAGAAIGAVMVCLFFGFGAVVLQVVARIAPEASLLIALLTYLLKVVAIGLVFVGLTRSGALDGSVDANWLGGAIVACTLVWVSAQVTVNMRTRQLIYDLPQDGEEANTR
jgi:ATP synthase protein I